MHIGIVTVMAVAVISPRHGCALASAIRCSDHVYSGLERSACPAMCSPFVCGKGGVVVLRLRGGTAVGGPSISHLLPHEESESSGEMDLDRFTQEEKQNYHDNKYYEEWQAQYTNNYTTVAASAAGARHYESGDQLEVVEVMLEERMLRRKIERRNMHLLKSNAGAAGTWVDQDGQHSAIIDSIDPTRRAQDSTNSIDSSEDTPVPEPKNEDATLEFMFKNLLNLQRRNEDDNRYDNTVQQDKLRHSSFYGPLSSLQEERGERLFKQEMNFANTVIDSPYIDDDGNAYNISCSAADFKGQHGIYDLPLTTEEDFHHAKADCGPSAASAVDAWEMFKGKDLEGFDTICLRHKTWGTEVEFFIGSRGSFKTRPSPLHQVSKVEVDGTYFKWEASYEQMECPHIFDALWNNFNASDSEGNAWRDGGRDWMEAKGGADDYLYQAQSAHLPCGAQPIDLGVLKSEQGWVPCQDRWADFDLLNTSYIRTRPKPTNTWRVSARGGEQNDVFTRHASAPYEGNWRGRMRGSRVVWDNKHSLVELHLTTEGFVFLSDCDEWRSQRSRAVRVEYGMAGCTDGVNRLYTLTNLQARRLLLLPEPPEAATQRVAQAPTQSVTGKLYAWCSMHGWHDLQRRLLDRGRSALESFQEIVRQIRLGAQHAAACGEPVPYVDLERHVYSLPYIQGNRDKFRKVQIFGMDDEGLPLQIVDGKSCCSQNVKRRILRETRSSEIT